MKAVADVVEIPLKNGTMLTLPRRQWTEDDQRAIDMTTIRAWRRKMQRERQEAAKC